MALELHICPNELKPARTGNLSNKLQPVSIHQAKESFGVLHHQIPFLGHFRQCLVLSLPHPIPSPFASANRRTGALFGETQHSLTGLDPPFRWLTPTFPPGRTMWQSMG